MLSIGGGCDDDDGCGAKREHEALRFEVFSKVNWCCMRLDGKYACGQAAQLQLKEDTPILIAIVVC